MGKGNRNRIIFLAVGFLISIASSTLSPLFPAYIKSVGGSLADIGIFFTVYSCAGFPCR